jgi:protein required for attachment to host cells
MRLIKLTIRLNYLQKAKVRFKKNPDKFSFDQLFSKDYRATIGDLMKQPKAWILAANASKARIFSQNTEGKWEEVNAIYHDASRLKKSDLVTDKQGATSSHGAKGRSHMEPKTTAKEHEVDVFAHELATYLRLASQLGKFSKLHIVAAPAFLGKLRHELHSEVKSKLGGQISKDGAQEPLEKILKDLEGHFLD